MIKKLLVTVAAAGALSVPLAGVACADPNLDNPGVPGNIGGTSPGETFRQVAKLPGSVPDVISDLTGGQLRTPARLCGHSRRGMEASPNAG